MSPIFPSIMGIARGGGSMSTGLAYNIIQSEDSWKGNGIFKQLIGRTLLQAYLGSIPLALQRTSFKIASSHIVNAAGIFENFANDKLSRKGPCEALFFLPKWAQLLSGRPDSRRNTTQPTRLKCKPIPWI